MPGQPLKILYIGASSRSGSTVLGNVLGEIDGFLHVGELAALWRGLLEGVLCGCGRALTECELWSRVVTSIGAAPPREIMQLQREVVGLHEPLGVRSFRKAGRLIRQRPGEPIRWHALRSYAALLEKIYWEASEQSNARVIVDSSKWPPVAAVLRLIPSVSPYYLHLVRDPRGTAYSWNRHKALADRKHQAEMRRYATWVSAGIWTGLNLLGGLVGNAYGERALSVLYEELMHTPRFWFERIITEIDEWGVDLPLVSDHAALLGPNHTVGGNPDRFATGWVELRADARWTKELTVPQRVAVTVLGLPGILYYGYPLWPK